MTGGRSEAFSKKCQIRGIFKFLGNDIKFFRMKKFGNFRMLIQYIDILFIFFDQKFDFVLGEHKLVESYCVNFSNNFHFL